MARERDRAEGYRVLGSAKRWVAMLSIVGTAAFAGLAARATQTHTSNQSSGGGSQATSNTSDDSSSSLSEDGSGSGFSDGGTSFFGNGSAPSRSFSPPAASSGGS